LRAYALACASVSFLISLPTAGQQPSASPPQQAVPQAVQTPKPPPLPLKHVHVDLTGFELDKAAPPVSSTQIGGGTRDIGGVTTLLAPRFSRVYTAHPVFRWSHTTQAQNFEFRLFDATGSLVYKAHASGREFHYPDAAPLLQPGSVYTWNVRPETALLGGASMTYRFIRLAQVEIDDISKALEQIDPGGKRQAERRAELLTDRRLWFEAVQAYSDLIKDYPTDSDLFQRRGTIYDQIPVTKPLAEEDFAVADKLRAAQAPKVFFSTVALGQSSASQGRSTAHPDLVLQVGHARPISALAFSPDGKWLASGSDDLTIKIWDLAAGSVVRTIQSETRVATLAISPDAKLLAAGGGAQ
jgi:hypothetical protein